MVSGSSGESTRTFRTPADWPPQPQIPCTRPTSDSITMERARVILTTLPLNKAGSSTDSEALVGCGCSNTFPRAIATTTASNRARQVLPKRPTAPFLAAMTSPERTALPTSTRMYWPACAAGIARALATSTNSGCRGREARATISVGSTNSPALTRSSASAGIRRSR